MGQKVNPHGLRVGVLKLFVPKAEVKQVPAQTAIAIE